MLSDSMKPLLFQKSSPPAVDPDKEVKGVVIHSTVGEKGPAEIYEIGDLQLPDYLHMPVTDLHLPDSYSNALRSLGTQVMGIGALGSQVMGIGAMDQNRRYFPEEAMKDAITDMRVNWDDFVAGRAPEIKEVSLTEFLDAFMDATGVHEAKVLYDNPPEEVAIIVSLHDNSVGTETYAKGQARIARILRTLKPSGYDSIEVTVKNREVIRYVTDARGQDEPDESEV